MLCLLAALALAQPVPHAVDGDASLVYALVYKSGAASAVAHDHAIRARSLQGTVVLDPDDPTACSVEVEVDLTSLDPAAPAARAAAGLDGQVSERHRQTIQRNLSGEEQLFVERFPVASFRSSVCARVADRLELTGVFSLRGVERPLTTTLQLADGRLTGGFSLLQSDFGYAPYTAALGALRVRDQVDVVVELALR